MEDKFSLVDIPARLDACVPLGWYLRYAWIDFWVWQPPNSNRMVGVVEMSGKAPLRMSHKTFDGVFAALLDRSIEMRTRDIVYLERDRSLLIQLRQQRPPMPYLPRTKSE